MTRFRLFMAIAALVYFALAGLCARWLAPRGRLPAGRGVCQAVPGATAMQCAAYVGLRVRGLWGAVLAYVGFGLPAFLLMLSLSIAYRYAVPLQPVTSILAGLRVLVVLRS